MRNKYFILVAGIIISASTGNAADLNDLAIKAVSADANIAASAIATLRAQGPAALQALEKVSALPRFQTALTGVSGQCDNETSMLYWYTDFDQARAAAKASGKPILSLRLLGRLDEEYSCANSRFFRSTLYANAEVGEYLRHHFILHWKSVRPVPRVTIDFGDGRKIERTLTGNSVHYILDADGQPIDALPGLYGPKAFLKGLADAEKAALKSSALTGDAKTQFLRQYHNERYTAILQNWQNDLKTTGHSATQSMQTADEAVWASIARLHLDDAQLDAASRAVIQRKHPTALQASWVAVSKTRVENPLVMMMGNLQRSIAEDTVRNEYLLHSQIHQWLAVDGIAEDIDRLNSKVYAKLFLTPDSDPWLGLVPANTFTGLENNGLVQTVAH